MYVTHIGVEREHYSLGASSVVWVNDGVADKTTVYLWVEHDVPGHRGTLKPLGLRYLYQ